MSGKCRLKIEKQAFMQLLLAKVCEVVACVPRDYCAVTVKCLNFCQNTSVHFRYTVQLR